MVISEKNQPLVLNQFRLLFQLWFNNLKLTHAAHKFLRVCCFRFQYSQHVVNSKLRVHSFTTGIAIQSSKAFLGIRVNREMAFR